MPDKKKTTAKSLPGSGLVKSAGIAIETRKAKQDAIMQELFGSKK